MVHFAFFGSSIATPVPAPLLCSTCLAFLLNVLRYSPRGVLYVYSEKTRQTPKKKTMVEFFLKIC